MAAKKRAKKTVVKPISQTVEPPPIVEQAEQSVQGEPSIQEEIQSVIDKLGCREPSEFLNIALTNLRKAIVWIDRA